MEEKKHILTAEGLKRYEDELYYLKNERYKEITQAIKEARAQGDLSENFEYYAARRENGTNNSRIRYLERMLKNAVIVEDHSSADEVGLNKTVTVYIEEDDECETYRIVTSIRGNSMKNLISIESPLGKALLRHRVGDTVTIPVSDTYSYDVVIREIQDTDGEEDDSIRTF